MRKMMAYPGQEGKSRKIGSFIIIDKVINVLGERFHCVTDDGATLIIHRSGYVHDLNGKHIGDVKLSALELAELDQKYRGLSKPDTYNRIWNFTPEQIREAVRRQNMLPDDAVIVFQVEVKRESNTNFSAYLLGAEATAHPKAFC